MLAARVLTEFYDEVTVIDRDPLPDEVTPRRGYPQIVGRRTALTRLAGRYTQRLLKTAAADGTVAEQLLRVLDMVDPPSKLMAPRRSCCGPHA